MLPVGAARNDLRQLAQGLLRLYRLGLTGNSRLLKGRPGISGKALQLAASFMQQILALD
jgi:hypothetical protein